MTNLCDTCIETKDKPMTYARCIKCKGWRQLTEEERKKIACLNADGSINKEKWGIYKDTK